MAKLGMQRRTQAAVCLQQLLDANRTIVSELSLPAVLRHIVQSARETAVARYAALGVIDSDGQGGRAEILRIVDRR